MSGVVAQLTLEGIGSCIVSLASPGKIEMPLDDRPSRGDRLRVTVEYVVRGVGDDEDFDNNGIGKGEGSLEVRTSVLPGSITVTRGATRQEAEAEWTKRVTESRNIRELVATPA